MLFTTDKQTLEDLNIFGKHGEGGVYGLFNRTITRGGAAVLEEMFQHPLSDDKAINRRSGIIAFFSEAGLVLPFTAAYFDAIEPYLANVDERTKLATADPGLGKKITNLVAMDGDTAMIYKGVQALVDLVLETRGFMQQLQLPVGHSYVADRDAVLQILEEPELAPVMQHTLKSKLSHSVLAAYDVLLRFRHRSSILRLLGYLYQLDAYLSVARTARDNAFAFPVALPGSALSVTLKGLYHPLVKQAVANDLSIDANGNVIFLTGANMAGKSTFMKSLSIALFLAHMGFPVPATHMEFNVLDGIYTTINLPDNLGMGASHFYAEVLRVKKMMHELSQGKRLFILFDELFRGTNVKDAYEATIAIIKAFARRRDSLFVISTHIIEAGAVLQQSTVNVRFLYLPTQMKDHTPVYTYKLATGITDDRHGMIIINKEGILDILKTGLLQK